MDEQAGTSGLQNTPQSEEKVKSHLNSSSESDSSEKRATVELLNSSISSSDSGSNEVNLTFMAKAKINFTKLLQSLGEDADDITSILTCYNFRSKGPYTYVIGQFQLRMPISTADRLFGHDRQLQPFSARNVILMNNNRPASTTSFGFRDSGSSNDAAETSSDSHSVSTNLKSSNEAK